MIRLPELPVFVKYLAADRGEACGPFGSDWSVILWSRLLEGGDDVGVGCQLVDPVPDITKKLRLCLWHRCLDDYRLMLEDRVRCIGEFVQKLAKENNEVQKQRDALIETMDIVDAAREDKALLKSQIDGLLAYAKRFAQVFEKPKARNQEIKATKNFKADI